MHIVMLTIGALAFFWLLLERAWVLIPGPLGWLFQIANIAGETGQKKLGLARWQADALVLLAASLAWWLGGVPGYWIAMTLAVVVSSELVMQNLERRLLVDTYTIMDKAGLGEGSKEKLHGLAQGMPSPTAYPDLVLNLRGPFVERRPRYQLGSLVRGQTFSLVLQVGNHTNIPCATEIAVMLRLPAGLRLIGDNFVRLAPLGVAGVHSWNVEFSVEDCVGAGQIRFSVAWGDQERWLDVAFADCVDRPQTSTLKAALVRYPGASRSAFAWRGDMDLYDTATAQSIEGLEVTLGLGARYRVAQTMYLSTHLSLDEGASQAWTEHYGVSRGVDQIGRFRDWLGGQVKLSHRASYPSRQDRPFVMELGNHGHLHFGTDMAAAAENKWQPRSRMGAGVYPWESEDHSSFAEQRDNAIECRRQIENAWGFTVKSWAMPDRTRDEHTPRAMEAAGCEVLSDSDVRTLDNVLFQPPPHVLPGTRAVELTKRYPGDPQSIQHVGMNLFWFHRAHRLGIPVIFMCHQHMRQFDGHATTRMTEYLLRYVLTRFNGDLHINTVYGIGKYWLEVLNPDTRRVHVRIEGDEIVVDNQSDADFFDLTVDLEGANGLRFCRLVDAPAGKVVRLALWTDTTATRPPHKQAGVVEAPEGSA